MDSKLYLPLNSWLQKSDHNYISGRFLWLNMLIDGACNLLWLSCEQIIKILLMQKNTKRFYQCSNLKDVHLIIDKEGIKMGHNIAKLVDSINIEYPELKIVKYKSVLEKLQEYFYRRYVVNSSSSINSKLIDRIDELYFLLRNKIEPEVGLGVIDEIFIQKKHNWKHPIPAFHYAYLDNKSFLPRKHGKIRLMGPDKKIYEEEGF